MWPLAATISTSWAWLLAPHHHGAAKRLHRRRHGQSGQPAQRRDQRSPPELQLDGHRHNYTIEIATDAAFTNIVESATVATTNYTSSGLGGNFTYYWRVTADNVCGAGVSVPGTSPR